MGFVDGPMVVKGVCVVGEVRGDDGGSGGR